MTTLGTFLSTTAACHQAHFGDRARAQQELWTLACTALGWPLTRLLANSERPLDTITQTALVDLLARRLAGEPLAYITGHAEFWSLTLQVSPAVLVPRPETEHVVERALVALHARHAPSIMDLGTGSGAIALAIKSERPDARVWATDRSRAALAVAVRNARRHRLAVAFLAADWGAALRASTIDVVVANPPYIESRDPCLDDDGLRAEPTLALDGGNDGLGALRAIIADAPRFLTPGGQIILEHGHDQGPAVAALLAAFGFDQIATYRDHSDHERVTEGTSGGG
ncbi:MAG: peptide chain release factor N(5)-glutamine methyltransferase [Acidiferrobacter sp.]